MATFCPFYELKHTCPRPRVESCYRINPPLFFCPAQAIFLVFTQFATIPAGMRRVSLWISLDSISRLQLVPLQDEAGRFSGWILALDAGKRLPRVQGGAADVLRHCSLLHVYCSFPLGTWLLALSPFPSLPLCIYYADTLSLSPSLFSLLFLSFISSPGPTFLSPLSSFVGAADRGSTAPPCVRRDTSQVHEYSMQNALTGGILDSGSLIAV